MIENRLTTVSDRGRDDWTSIISCSTGGWETQEVPPRSRVVDDRDPDTSHMDLDCFGVIFATLRRRREPVYHMQ